LQVIEGETGDVLAGEFENTVPIPELSVGDGDIVGEFRLGGLTINPPQ
jgi:hypothetical protein